MRALEFFSLAALFLGVAGSRHRELVEARREHHLQEVAPEDTTPLVAITTVAFGGFRGLVADALWVRANELQESGQYFELVQLATWITQLEPRVPQVWSFHAWNLAYNISVFFPDPEDRWRWVIHGLNLLRHDGLTHNPTSPDLHWDIGWMFQHKIGMEMDQAHLHYKRRLAEEMDALLDGPRVDAADPALLHRLRTEWRMDFAFMRELDIRYGPLDWRIPSTHVLYWAARGEPLAREGFRRRMLQRMRMQALADLLRRGRVLGNPATAESIGVPRLELLPVVMAEYESALAQQPNNAILRSGFRSFLLDAVLLHIDYGNLETAWTLYQRLAALDREIDPSAAAFERVAEAHLTLHPAEFSREQALTRVVAQLRLARSLDAVNPAQAAGLRGMARQTHRLYQESRSGEEHLQRTGLLPLETLEALIATDEN